MGWRKLEESFKLRWMCGSDLDVHEEFNWDRRCCDGARLSDQRLSPVRFMLLSIVVFMVLFMLLPMLLSMLYWLLFVFL